MIELGDISCTYAHVGRSLRIRLWSRRRRHLFCGHAEERARIMLSRIVPSFSVFMADKTLAYSPRLRLGLYARVLSAIKTSNSGTILYLNDADKNLHLLAPQRKRFLFCIITSERGFLFLIKNLSRL